MLMHCTIKPSGRPNNFHKFREVMKAKTFGDHLWHLLHGTKIPVIPVGDSPWSCSGDRGVLPTFMMKGNTVF